jgi:hypothetical protein
MTDYNYLSKGNVLGTVLGQKTTSLISFYGIQPVDQPASLTAAVSTFTYVTATLTAIIVCSTTATLSSYGVVTSGEVGGLLFTVKNLQTRIGELEAVLVEVGLLAGGTSITTTTATPFDFVGWGTDEGSLIGKASTSLLSFYGVAPCDQPAAVVTASTWASLTMTATITPASAVSTMSMTVAAAMLGWGSDVDDYTPQASLLGTLANMMTRLGSMETNLTEVGILAGGTALTSADYDYLSKGSDSGTIFGRDANAKISFWGATPVAQAAALTTALTTIAHTSLTAPVYVLTTMLSGSSVYKFVNVTMAQSFIHVVINAQTRLRELEAVVDNLGLQAT